MARPRMGGKVICGLLVSLISCTDKAKEEPVDLTDQDVLQNVPHPNRPQEEDLYPTHTELSEWTESLQNLNTSICIDSVPPNSAPYIKCTIDAASERCMRFDWCYIDCTRRDMGRLAGGGCWHLCYNRIEAPEGFEECFD